MSESAIGYLRIIAATDFSTFGDAAVRQAHWAARQFACPLTVAHVVSDLRRAVAQTSHQSRVDFLEGREERFQLELRRHSDEKLKALIEKLPLSDIQVSYETLLGQPHIELIHAVQQEGYDLLVCGARQTGDWIKTLLGSTARRLVRKCPCTVWVVKRAQAAPPGMVLAPTDLSAVSRTALLEAIALSKISRSRLHVLHVVETDEIPDNLLDVSAGPQYSSLRHLIADEAEQRLGEFLSETRDCGVEMTSSLAWGRPAEAIVRTASELQADLIAIGTVGRSGLEGLFLGNTAESVLTASDCNVLAVKPAGFLTPVEPTAQQLHP